MKPTYNLVKVLDPHSVMGWIPIQKIVPVVLYILIMEDTNKAKL